MLSEDLGPLLKSYCRYTIILKGMPTLLILLLFDVNIIPTLERCIVGFMINTI